MNISNIQLPFFKPYASATADKPPFKHSDYFQFPQKSNHLVNNKPDMKDTKTWRVA